MPSYTITVNNEPRVVDADPDMPLLWILRDMLGLTGTRYGCGVGVCGSCVVHVDGEPRRSCVTSAETAHGRAVTTIEGLSSDRSHPVQKAWLAEDVPQCGYCQSGQIMLAAALLTRNPDPSDAEIDEAMRDSVCRCGTYQRIRRAIHRAAEEV
ncbi:MAG: (2Fe-2S)-binding protein [Anaerolineae bacterium]